MVPRSETPSYELLSDRPCIEVGDPFGFEHLGVRLKRLILNSRASTPFTIGIEAPWGAGKSSLMRQLERQLEGEAGRSDPGHWWQRLPKPRPEVEIRTVWFNAWTAAEADVQEGLVKSVLQALDRRILARALRKKKLMTLLRAAVLTAAGVFKLTPLVDAAWESLSADARTRNEINDLVSRAVSEWAEPTPRRRGRRPAGLVVVFIDDLDRCSRANVTRVLEAVKLYLDAAGLVFVVGYDPQRIDVADRSRAPDGVPAETDEAEYYLDKIIQIVFRIPPPDERTAKQIIPDLKDGRTDAALFDDASSKLIVEYNGRNPRRIKRFVNRFIVDYQLHETVEDLQPALLVKALILETHFPGFARMLAVEADPNPIEHFLLYVDAREAVRQQADASALQRLLTVHDRPVEGSAADTLARLEDEEVIPPAFVDLCRNRDFVQLARSLVSADEHQRLFTLMARRRRERFNFDGLDLRDRSFDGADLTGASLVGADLSGVSAERVILAGADMANARLDETRLFAADLRNANLTGASLVGADLRDAHLRHADLRLASFERADLSQASLSEARLEGARFDGANFDRTDLTGARWDPIGGAGLRRRPSGKKTPLTDLDVSPSVVSRLREKGISTAEDLVTRAEADHLTRWGRAAAGTDLKSALTPAEVSIKTFSFLGQPDDDLSAERLLDLYGQALLVRYLGQLNIPSIRSALREVGIRTIADFIVVFGRDDGPDPGRSPIPKESPLGPFLERFREVAAYWTGRGESSRGDVRPAKPS